MQEGQDRQEKHKRCGGPFFSFHLVGNKTWHSITEWKLSDPVLFFFVPSSLFLPCPASCLENCNIALTTTNIPPPSFSQAELSCFLVDITPWQSTARISTSCFSALWGYKRGFPWQMGSSVSTRSETKKPALPWAQRCEPHPSGLSCCPRAHPTKRNYPREIKQNRRKGLGSLFFAGKRGAECRRRKASFSPFHYLAVSAASYDF